MRSNRLALVLVAVGTGLLGSSAASVVAIADSLPAGTTAPLTEQPGGDHGCGLDRGGGDGGDHGRDRGV